MIKSIRTLAFIIIIFTSCHAFAQDKVIVVPLLKSSTPTGAAFDGDNSGSGTTLTSTFATIRTVVVNVPSAGVIIANASGYMDLNDDIASWAVCEITKDSTVEGSNVMVFGNHSTASRFTPFGATRGFNVANAGEVTIRLMCREIGGNTDIADSNLTVMFFPNELK